MPSSWFTDPPKRTRKYGVGWWAKIGIHVPTIHNGEVFGNHLVARVEQVNGAGNISSAQAFGNANVGRGPVSIVPSAIASAQGLGNPSVTTTYTISTTGIASAFSAPSPTITTGSIGITAAGQIVSLEALGNPAISVGPVSVSPSGIISLEAIPNPAIGVGPVSIAPPAITSAETLPGPVVGRGPVSILPGGIPSEEVVPELIIGNTTFIGPLFGIPNDTNLAEDPSCENSALWGSNSVSGATVEVTTEAAYEGTGCVKVVRTDVSWCTITPIRNPNNGNNAHNYEIIPGQKVRISGRMAPVPSSTDETFYARCFVRFRDENNAIISGFAQYDTALMTTAEPEWYLLEAEAITPENAVWIDTGFYMNNNESVGNGYYLDDVVYEKQTVMEPTISVGPVDISPTSIPSLENVSSAAISVGPVSILPSAIPSLETIGAQSLSVGPVSINPPAIASSESIGAHVITTGPVGITGAGNVSSQENVNEVVVTPDGVTLSTAGGIESGEAFGTPTTVDHSVVLLNHQNLGTDSSSSTVNDDLPDKTIYIPPGTDFILICGTGYNSSSATFTFSMSLNDVAMAMDVVRYANNDSGANQSFLVWAAMTNPPTGNVTLRTSRAASGFVTIDFQWFTRCYKGVGGSNGPFQEYGTESGSSMAMSYNSVTPGAMVICAMAADRFSSTDYLDDFNGDEKDWGEPSGETTGCVGQRRGGTSVSFDATRQSGYDYVRSVIELLPA